MKYYVFLKAVNVGGKSLVDMGRLKQALEASGVNDVQSYLNSGNLILECAFGKQETAERVKRLAKTLFEVETEAFVKASTELAEVLAKAPYKANEDIRSKQLVYFLSGPGRAGGVEELRANPRVVETIYLFGDLLFAYYPSGVARSGLTLKLIEKALGQSATGRNMNTIEGLSKR
jgi:uncharacterized protein (DUF1697 family)